MANLAQRLARASSNRSIPLAIATALLAISPLATRATPADEIIANIDVKGGTVTNTDNAVFITYTRAQIEEAGVGSLQFKAGSATAAVLAVGGGGGGGRVISQNNGGGGGGGAGGFVEVTKGLSFKGTYTIVVGKGGAGEKSSSKPSVAVRGGKGGDTTITKNDVQVADIAVAYGGGGGGAGGKNTSTTGQGQDGGSGGGGSARQQKTSGTAITEERGGTGVSGQGNNGGDSNMRLVAGGGGGAGGAGTTITGKNSDPAYGGVGKQSQITGVWYAGGGAGGMAATSGGAGIVEGSLGGGGSGGSGDNKTQRDAVANTGGGGGGSTHGSVSGNGADGVLVIRLTDYLAGGVMPPPAPDLTWNGQEQTAAVNTANYTVSGDVKKTDAGHYTMTVTLTELGKSIGWDPDLHISGDSTTVEWEIKQKPINKPAPTKDSFTYDGTEQQGFVESDDYSLSAENKQTNAGTYTVTAKLADAKNMKWADNVADPRSDLKWTIAKKLIEAPKRIGTYPYTCTYSGEVQQGYADSADYTYDEWNRQTNAGTYTPTATLKDTVNTAWKNGEPSLSWTIESFKVDENAISARTGLTFDGTEQTAFERNAAQTNQFSLAGNVATNAGNYTMTATLNNPPNIKNYTWNNGETGPKTWGWSIAVRTVTWPPTGALPNYGYDGKEKKPIPADKWYTIDGTSFATNAGSYSCTATLKYNFDEQTNVKWSDGGTAPKTWDWSIGKQSVDLPTVKDFVYDENPKGSPIERTTLTIAEDALYRQTDGDELTQTDAGLYSVTLALKDNANYEWTGLESSDPQEQIWTISPATNEITNLSVESWQVGTPNRSSPSCSVRFGNSVPTYEWSTSKESKNWKSFSNKEQRPTEPGSYWLRASLSAQKNWTAAVAYRPFCVWKNPKDIFTDFIDFEIPEGEAGKIVRVKIAAAKEAGGVVTDGLPGFEYARTDAGLCFVVTNANKQSDQLCMFSNVVWNLVGESTLAVKLPPAQEMGGTKTLRMYWHAVEGPVPDNYPDEVGGDGGSATSLSAATLVNREGTWIDYWTEAPKLSQTIWVYGETSPTESDVTPGHLRTGNVEWFVLSMPRGTTNEVGVMQTAVGTYRVVFTRKSAADAAYTIYNGEKTVGYDVIWHNTYETFGGTASGRILLGNNDTNEKAPVSGQAYYETDSTQETFWSHSLEKAPTLLPNLSVGIMHTLYQNLGTSLKELWRVENAWQGSLYPRSGTASDSRNYLPWSTTCSPRTAPDASMSTKEVTCFALHNMAGSAIYSPCYTNGIGTIYFDAVNGWTDDSNAKLVVEIATETSKGLPPTDENCRKEDGTDPFFYLTHDEMGNPLAESKWKKVLPTVLIKRATSDAFVEDASQGLLTSEKTIQLKVTTGGKTTEFYRIVVPVKEYGACRFRIYRPEASVDGQAADQTYLILVDNIIASPPAMYAELESPGRLDPDLKGKQAIGQSGALSVPFPSRNTANLFGRAKVHFRSTAGIDCDLSDFIASARIHYRWRYLKQDYVPADGEDWNEVYLDPGDMRGEEGELISAVAPFALPGRVGDVEWYYDMTLHAPAYKYVDYSGCGVENPVMDYNEEVQSVVNHMTDYMELPVGGLASWGTNWFVRLREGASDYESVRILAQWTDSKGERTIIPDPIRMELTDNHIWRGFLKTIDGAGTIRYRIEALNPQEPGAEFFTSSTNCYKSIDATEVPVSTILKPGTEDDWATVPCDAATGYLLFQFDDSTLSLTITHADYMDCNGWNDAHRADGARPIFVGTSTEDSKKSGVSSKQRNFEERFSTWTDTPPTNKLWTETFEFNAEPSNLYKPFDEAISPNGWHVLHGQYVYQSYKSRYTAKSSDPISVALQLEGRGQGKIEMRNPAEQPRGIGTVTYSTRLAQELEWDDIAYCWTGEALTQTNCTFFTKATMSQSNWNTTRTEGVDDFNGPGSLSLFGCLRLGQGAYEFRVTRIKDFTAELALYKWVPGRGSLTATLVGATTNDYGNAADTPFLRRSVNADKTDYHFPYLYFSYQVQSDGSVKIQGGLSRGRYLIGAIEPEDTKWDSVCYWDADPGKLKGGGTYGLASANCPGFFGAPYTKPKAVTFLSSCTRGKFTKTEFTKPEAVTFNGTSRSCRRDIQNDWWAIEEGRLTAEVDSSIPVGEPDSINPDDGWGLRADALKPRFVVEWLKKGADESKWEILADEIVESYTLSAPKTINVWKTEDGDVRFRQADDYTTLGRADVIVDNLKVTQWRGDNWGSPDTDSYIPHDATSSVTGWMTNFIFTTAWIEDHTVKLSAKRAVTTAPCSIRTPLMDGQGNVGEERGIGLGMIYFAYKNAQANVNLQVQIATNVFGTAANINQSMDESVWVTVTNFDFSACSPAERQLGSRVIYLGLHGVQGAMRIRMDPAVIEAVKDERDTSKFGEIEITEVFCRDEPVLDKASWWGWNIRTFSSSTEGLGSTALDDGRMSYLPDPSEAGLSIALNNSTTNNISRDAKETDYEQHMPFVQTPTFTSNIVGEVMFRARCYANDGQFAEVQLYGAPSGDLSDDSQWRPLARFIVSNMTYSTYSYRSTGAGYRAFRFAVTGVPNVEYSGPSPELGDSPVRVLLDEMIICEAIRPTLGFEYCYPIRGQLSDNSVVAAVDGAGNPLMEEQPLLDESWTVQAKIKIKQLPDEIDLVGRKPRVYFHWYPERTPWGYENWKDQKADGIFPAAHVAELVRADGEEMIFRGSVPRTPTAIVEESSGEYAVVQYMAEVVYWNKAGVVQTNQLLSSEWKRPEWFSPVDYNRGQPYFSAFTIVDAIAPHRVWINEINVFDGLDTRDYSYPGVNNQYVEIAVPQQQAIDGWRLEYVANNFETNTLCTFGTKKGNVPATKTLNETNEYVFITVQSPQTAKTGLWSAEKGEVDGTWANVGGTGELDYVLPVALQLVRPSQVVEQAVTFEGTNFWGASEESSVSLKNYTKELNEKTLDGHYTAVGTEYGNGPVTGPKGKSLGVFKNVGLTSNEWNNTMHQTPGRCNEGQEVPFGWVIYPNGAMMIVYGRLGGDGHVRQTFGTVVDSFETAMGIVAKGGAGTNITYTVDNWWEIASLTTNGVPVAGYQGKTGTFSYCAGRGASNNVTVVATAQPQADLREKYGLTTDNRYTPAVMDWLMKGKNLFEEEFKNPGEIHLAEFWSITGNVITNLSLTDMYWLDIDPTEGNWVLQAGIVKAPSPILQTVSAEGSVLSNARWPAYEQVTNLRVTVRMTITNTASTRAWAPYVLRGLEIGSTSYDHDQHSTANWTSETFKVTGDIQNGMPMRKRWVPLRWFYFLPNLGAATDRGRSASFDENFESEIEIWDPFDKGSGTTTGWEAYKDCPVFYGWSIDGKNMPVSVEPLVPHAIYSEQ